VTVAESTSISVAARLLSAPMDLKAAVAEFAKRIETLLEAQSMERAKAEILGAFGIGIGTSRKPGRPAKKAAAIASVATPVTAKARKKMPPQFCPVPGCKNKAAPIFGMVCAKHKDVPKALIKRYREERRAKKAGVKPAKSAPTKRAKRVAKKAKRAKPVAKKAAPLRPASAAKKVAKGRPKATKKRTEKAEPIAKETVPAAPPTAET
jgi:hypothetical protein